jgi:hypothetical protein
MPSDNVALERSGISPHQIKLDARYFEDRVADCPQMTALLLTLNNLVPGFSDEYKRHLLALDSRSQFPL